jgi:hypothetical protein
VEETKSKDARAGSATQARRSNEEEIADDDDDEYALSELPASFVPKPPLNDKEMAHIFGTEGSKCVITLESVVNSVFSQSFHDERQGVTEKEVKVEEDNNIDADAAKSRSVVYWPVLPLRFV